MANIMIEARRLAQKALGHHYMIQKREDRPEDQIRQSLYITDLERIGINCAIIDTYGELENALESIAVRSRGRTIFVTGGHTSSSRLPLELGKAMATDARLNVTLLDGQSTGVGRNTISSFSLECLTRKVDIRDRVRIFSNPYAIEPKFENDLSLLPQLKQWRTPLLRAAQIVVIFDGGKGTEAELEVARDHGCIIIPIPEKSGDLPSRLMANPEIVAQLAVHAPDYVTAASSGKVTARQICDCIAKLIAE